MKKISLFYNNSSHRGPGKVVSNLKSGLEQIGILTENNIYNVENFSGVLQPSKILEQSNINFDNFILGPNLFVLPSEWGQFCKKFNHFIVPSKWIEDKYRKFSELDHAKISIWSVGIDTDKWELIEREHKDLKCLLYFKNRSQQDLSVVKKILEKYNIEYKEIHYGFYSEEQLLSACNWANFSILLTNTESQGIGYMEILSTNLPCFVFNKSTWNYDGKYHNVPATSVPYFNEQCGIISENVDLIKFEEFLNNLKNNLYSPREFILKNHSLKESAQNYINLF